MNCVNFCHTLSHSYGFCNYGISKTGVNRPKLMFEAIICRYTSRFIYIAFIDGHVSAMFNSNKQGKIGGLSTEN